MSKSNISYHSTIPFLLVVLVAGYASAFSQLSSPCKSFTNGRQALLVSQTCYRPTYFPSRVSSLEMSWRSSHSNSHNQPRRRWALFQRPLVEAKSQQNLKRANSLLKNFRVRALWTAMAQVHAKVRRAFLILMASATIWLGTGVIQPPPAQAAPAAVERLMPLKNEQIIDKYVKQHMFDDDTSFTEDPLESAYREAYEDYETKGAYPRALREVASETLGQKAGRSSSNEGFSVATLLTRSIRALNKRGLSENAAIAAIASVFVIGTPSLFLMAAMIVGGASKRNMNRVMKERYGDSYT